MSRFTARQCGAALPKFVADKRSGVRTLLAVTPAQLRIVRGIRSTVASLGRWPSVRELAKAVSLSVTMVRRHLRGLVRLGVVSLDSGVALVREPDGIWVRP